MQKESPRLVKAMGGPEEVRRGLLEAMSLPPGGVIYTPEDQFQKPTYLPPLPQHIEDRRPPLDVRPQLQEIINLLEQARKMSGFSALQIFTDWLTVCMISLVEYPTRLAMNVGGKVPTTYELHLEGAEGENPLTLQLSTWEREESARQILAVGANYGPRWDQVWLLFREAFMRLWYLTAPGLWYYNQFKLGHLGPDFLAELMVLYTQYDRQEWFTEPLLSWSQLSWSAMQMLLWDSNRSGVDQPMDMIYQRLRAACEHPANQAGRELLSRTTFDEQTVTDRPEEVLQWIIKEMLPVAGPYYESLGLADKFPYTATRLLAMAAQFPEWAVVRGLVTFSWLLPEDEADQEKCHLGVMMCQIMSRAYGLNGYYLVLSRILQHKALDGHDFDMLEPASIIAYAAHQSAVFNLLFAPTLNPLLSEIEGPVADEPVVTGMIPETADSDSFESMFRGKNGL